MSFLRFVFRYSLFLLLLLLLLPHLQLVLGFFVLPSVVLRSLKLTQTRCCASGILNGYGGDGKGHGKELSRRRIAQAMVTVQLTNAPVENEEVDQCVTIDDLVSLLTELCCTAVPSSMMPHPCKASLR